MSFGAAGVSGTAGGETAVGGAGRCGDRGRVAGRWRQRTAAHRLQLEKDVGADASSGQAERAERQPHRTPRRLFGELGGKGVARRRLFFLFAISGGSSSIETTGCAGGGAARLGAGAGVMASSASSASIWAARSGSDLPSGAASAPAARGSDCRRSPVSPRARSRPPPRAGLPACLFRPVSGRPSKGSSRPLNGSGRLFKGCASGVWLKKFVAGKLRAVCGKIAVQARILDDYRAQEDDQFRFGRCVVARIEQFADQGNLAERAGTRPVFQSTPSFMRPPRTAISPLLTRMTDSISRVRSAARRFLTPAFANARVRVFLEFGNARYASAAR